HRWILLWLCRQLHLISSASSPIRVGEFRWPLRSDSGANGRNGRGPAVDQEVCPDDVRRIVRREVNCQLRDFHWIGQPLARIVCPQQPLDRIALLFAWETTEHRRVSRAWAYGVHANPAVHELGAKDPSE